MMCNLEGKVAVVTGSTGGIGKDIVKALAGEKIKLVLAGRRQEKLQELKNEFGGKTEILTITCDVTKKDNLKNLISKTSGVFSGIDILINGAGVSSQHPFWNQPIEDIEKMIWTNYYSYVALTRMVVPIMKQNKFGHIINITSGSVMVDPPPRNFIVYTSLKVALRAFAKGLFWEMRDFGIKVTSIFPGVTSTPLTGKLKNISEERLIQPRAVADTVVFALRQPANVCPIELAVINQQTPWTKPVIPFKQEHPQK
ncbi:MAG: SDR family NAD(P)-dependent oxidoreductase [Candidatus Omnitrophica bacterium]|nr:SDR family NAD(P)-dependent oxidoreductase [Candidatus Omnitrophota bacterium]MBD3269471.1 SDR family NAD(P)-dependent oxidoreductase [Candidatus Omnitrophota bacterium]